MSWNGTPIPERDGIVSVADVRAAEEVFANATRYPDGLILQAITYAEELFERIAMLSYVPRTTTATVYGNGTREVMLPHIALGAVSAVSIDGTALDPTTVSTKPYGALVRSSGWPDGSVISVTYTHGTGEVPEPVRSAVLELVRECLLPRQVPSRATAMTTSEGNYYRYTIAGRDGYTGIPNVDAAADQFGARRPAVG